MSYEVRDLILESYFSAGGGLEYSLGRVAIGSTDFSTEVYSYNPYVDDLAQKHFSIRADADKIALIKRVFEIKEDVQLFASPWA
jgi:glucosylceramidase